MLFLSFYHFLVCSFCVESFFQFITINQLHQWHHLVHETSYPLSHWLQELDGKVRASCEPVCRGREGIQNLINLILFLHKLLSIILYVISCGQKINLFDQLCKDFILNLNYNFPWARLSHTLHGSMQHSVQLITLNDGYNWGNLSQERFDANKNICNELE